LHIRVEYLGRQVACQHCRRNFLAADPEAPGEAPADSGTALLRRADELLELAQSRRPLPR
jgi:hypothetical protein